MAIPPHTGGRGNQGKGMGGGDEDGRGGGDVAKNSLWLCTTFISVISVAWWRMFSYKKKFNSCRERIPDFVTIYFIVSLNMSSLALIKRGCLRN